MRNIKKLVIGISIALLLGIFAFPVQAGGPGNGAVVIKDSGGYSYDAVNGCNRFTGGYTWATRKVITRGRVVRQVIDLDGWSKGENLCSGSVFYESEWRQKVIALYFKDTGDQKLLRSMYRGKSWYLGYEHSYKQLLAIVDDQLRMSHYWLDGQKVF